MDHSLSPVKERILVLLVGSILVVTIGSGSGLAQPGSGYAGPETCLDCHEDLGTDYAHSVHGNLRDYEYPSAARGCEACHGPGQMHIDTGEATDILVPTAEQGFAGNENCLTCHNTGPLMDWNISVHADEDLSCLDCHQIHGPAVQPLLSQETPQLCYGCHMDQQAQFQLPSRHPIWDGHMTCTACHDVHQPVFTGLMRGEPSRQLCLRCHAQYMGPFIFEHSPVMESCDICHNAHGAVANNLLRQNEPFICLQCHQPHFHSGLMSIDGDYSVPDEPVNDYPGYAGLSGTSHSDSFKRVMMTKCTQCHPAVHGTDLPSQSIPGQGRALNR
jgi:DmsE family decaheme c-type cytochrome